MLDASSREVLPAALPVDLKYPPSLIDLRRQLPGVFICSVALSLSRLDSHLDRNFEWRDYGLGFHVTNNRQEDFVGCSWLGASTSITRGTTAPVEPTP